MTKRKPPNSNLPEHLLDAIRKAWPDGVVDMPIDIENAQFWNVYRKLKAKLARIPGVEVTYEREPQGENPSGQSDWEEGLSVWDEESRSYHLFFLSPLDDRFQFETDTLEPDEDGVEQRFRGDGRIGCVVGISLVAPFAVVALEQMEVFENGSRSGPGIEPHVFDLDGGKLDMEEYCRDMVGHKGLEILRKLRAEIVAVLNDHKIAVIPDKDLDQPVPWLRAGQGVFLGQPITVQNAFFFHGP
jgi:hypothetical protein